MIVRSLPDAHYLIRQSEHARQTGVLAAALKPEFLGPFEHQLPILRASALHDDGWDAWDAAPRFEANGLPVNFTAMDRGDHVEIWRRTIFGLLERLGPAEAAFLVQHAVMITTHEGEDRKPDYCFGELLEPLMERAWPGAAAEERAALAARGFSVLAAADALSLLACAGWDGRIPLELRNEAGRAVALEAWCEDDWTVRVAPWPFAPPEMPNVWVDAVAVPPGEEAAAPLLLRAPRDRAVRVRIDYRPG